MPIDPAEALEPYRKYPRVLAEPHLDRLGHRSGRRLLNPWAFVRFAREQGLELDLTTPPRRPDPRAALRHMTQALDRPAGAK